MGNEIARYNGFYCLERCYLSCHCEIENFAAGSILRQLRDILTIFTLIAW